MEGNAFGKRGRKGSEKGRGKRFNERFPQNLILCPSALEVEGEDEPGHEIAAADEPQGEHAARRKGLGPTMRTFSRLVSMPRAHMAMVSMKISSELMTLTACLGMMPSELMPMHAMNRTANHGKLLKL